MKSLVKAKSERGLWREETPRPEFGPNDVLIKVKKAAICGTDLHIYNWDKWAARTIPVPMVVGHEYLGVIEAVGARRDGAQSRPARFRRRAYRVRLLPQLPRRAGASLPQHAGRRRQPAGRLRRLRRDSRLQRLSRSPIPSPMKSPRFSIRSATRCIPPCRSISSARTC